MAFLPREETPGNGLSTLLHSNVILVPITGSITDLPIADFFVPIVSFKSGNKLQVIWPNHFLRSPLSFFKIHKTITLDYQELLRIINEDLAFGLGVAPEEVVDQLKAAFKSTIANCNY